MSDTLLPSGVQKATPGSAQDCDLYQHCRNQVCLCVCENVLMIIQMLYYAFLSVVLYDETNLYSLSNKTGCLNLDG